jgi:hypothetical protein
MVWKYHVPAHWDVCGGVPASYQLTEEDKQQLCISQHEFEKVLNKHKPSNREGAAAVEDPACTLGSHQILHLHTG